MKIIASVLLTASCLLGLMFIGGGVSVAASNPCDVDSTGVISEYCQGKNSTTSATKDPVTATVQKVSLLLSFIAGFLAVFWIIIQAIKMETSHGNADKIKLARNGIIYASVGLAIVVIAESFVFVILKLIG